MRLTRRTALASLGSVVAGTALAAKALSSAPRPRSDLGWSAPVAPGPTRSLAEIADRGRILFGASIDSRAFEHPAYLRLYEREAGVVTTDKALKFDWLRPTAHGFDFAPADQIVTFAASKNIKVRGHNLAWNANLPGWLNGLSRVELTRIFDEHIETVVSRYAGKLHSWDVVNEPFWPGDREAGGFRNGAWLHAMGPGYIERALRRTRAFDKTVRLVINEAHCEIIGGWGDGIRPRLLRLIDDLQDRGVPLDAIGLQGHLQPQWGYDDEAFADYVDQIAQRQLDVYITELDVNDAAFPDDPAVRDREVAARCSSFLTHVLKIPRVKLVVSWQLADPYSWYRNVPGQMRPGRSPRPLPFDERLARKPAWRAMADAFETICGAPSRCAERRERVLTNQG